MIKVGVFFGGKSVEHEISIISMIEATLRLDENKYEIVPIYIANVHWRRFARFRNV